ncbi:putative chromatin remodeling & transcription regulator BTB-POZ family [Helianthus annuus]|nr:putative chromatin remodeling & transcription regulator BTB-POZ family [Helianthus annuus]
MLAAMFSGRHTVNKDPEKGYVFIDRDGKHFGHILNWLRDGVAPILNLSDLERIQLLREAEYYQLLGLVERINEVLNKKKDERMDTDLTRTDIIKSIQSTSTYVKLRGVNLSGLDLSRLVCSNTFCHVTQD